jgi:DNA replication protein DnaC
MEPEQIDPLRHVPARVREHLSIGLSADDLVPDPAWQGESIEDVAARKATAAASRLRMWQSGVPIRFRDADLDALSDGQCAPHVLRWAASTDATDLHLVLRSEEPGLGKSYAAYAIGNYVVARGVWAQAWTMIGLNEAMRPGADETAHLVAQECALLVLDDVGKEKLSEWTLERFQSLLDVRWANKRRTVMTTNLDGVAFANRYGEAIVDRVTDGLTMCHFSGTSRRAPAPW